MPSTLRVVVARCCSCDEGCGGVLGPMLLFQLANWVWGEALGEGPSDAVDGEPRRAFFGGEPVGEMIEVLSRRSSLCETWRYFGAMILVDCETKEASATKESQPQSARPAKNIWPRPAGSIRFKSLVQMAGRTQLTATGFGEIQYTNKDLPCGAISRC